MGSQDCIQWRQDYIVAIRKEKRRQVAKELAQVVWQSRAGFVRYGEAFWFGKASITCTELVVELRGHAFQSDGIAGGAVSVIYIHDRSI